MEPGHDGLVVAAVMEARRPTRNTPQQGDPAVMSHPDPAPLSRTQPPTATVEAGAALLAARLPDLNALERREPSLRELLEDPIMDLLLARDGVAREEVEDIIRHVADRIIGNDCGPRPDGRAAA